MSTENKKPDKSTPASKPSKPDERPRESDDIDVRERGPDTGGGKLRPSDR